MFFIKPLRPFRFYSILIFQLIVITFSIGQSNTIFNGNKNCQSEHYEKVFVHLAKNIHVAGENLLFKTYIVNAAELIPASTSGIIYYDIISDKGKQMLTWRSNSTKGFSSGNILIPDTIASGIYTLRAYSNYMLNAGNEFVFQTPLSIINLRDEKIDNLPSTAYMGLQSTDLVSITDSSYILNAEFTTNELAVNLQCEDISHESLRLVTLNRGKIVFDDAIQLTSTKWSVNHPIQNIPEGQLTLLLLDKNNKILRERSILNKSVENNNLRLKQEKEKYTISDKIDITLLAQILDSTEVINLSCSVEEISDSVLFPGALSIHEYLLKYSDYSANSWYNNLLGSNYKTGELQWQNCLWNVHKEQTELNCNFIQEFDKHLVSGKITDKYLNRPVADAQILLSKLGIVPVIKYCFTNSNGEFFFWLDNSFDNAELLLQFSKSGMVYSDIMWEFYSNNLPNLLLISEPIKLNKPEQKCVERIKKLSLVNQIYFPLKPKNYINSNDPISSISYKPNLTIDPSDYEQLENFKEIADNILPGVYLKKRKDSWKLEIFDPENSIMLAKQGTVLLNGVPFSNLEYIADIPINNIIKIDVFKSHLIYGYIDFYGIVAIYTFDKSLPQNFIINEVHQLSNFVLPDDNEVVSLGTTQNNRKPNLQRLIYWNPQLTVTGENKEIKLEFSASGLKGNYLIKLEGISNTGIPYSIQKRITIE